MDNTSDLLFGVAGKAAGKPTSLQYKDVQDMRSVLLRPSGNTPHLLDSKRSHF
jgi:hypothetical protein